MPGIPVPQVAEIIVPMAAPLAAPLAAPVVLAAMRLSRRAVGDQIRRPLRAPLILRPACLLIAYKLLFCQMLAQPPVASGTWMVPPVSLRVSVTSIARAPSTLGGHAMSTRALFADVSA